MSPIKEIYLDFILYNMLLLLPCCPVRKRKETAAVAAYNHNNGRNLSSSLLKPLILYDIPPLMGSINTTRQYKMFMNNG